MRSTFGGGHIDEVNVVIAADINASAREITREGDRRLRGIGSSADVRQRTTQDPTTPAVLGGRIATGRVVRPKDATG